MKRIYVLNKIADYLINGLSQSEKLDILQNYWFIYEDHVDCLDDGLVERLTSTFPEDMYVHDEEFNPIVKLGLVDRYNLYNNQYLERIYHQYSDEKITINDDEMVLAVCPCCQFHALDVEDSFYDVCSICKWENDGSELLSYSHVNRAILVEYRRQLFVHNKIEDLKQLYVYSF